MRNPVPLAALAAVLLAAGPLHAEGAKPAKLEASKFLAAGAMDPAALLPPPPADGSPAARAELADLHRIEGTRTAVRVLQAQHDAEVEDVTAFSDSLGPAFDLAKLPATAKLFADLRAEDHYAAKQAKDYFQRTRPWAADPTLHTVCGKDDPVKSAYPSGHATMAFAASTVLAQLVPERAQAVQARAWDYAESRLVCGAHYRRDIQAGEAWGTVLAVKLLATPAFAAEAEAARRELQAAGVAR